MSKEKNRAINETHMRFVEHFFKQSIDNLVGCSINQSAFDNMGKFYSDEAKLRCELSHNENDDIQYKYNSKSDKMLEKLRKHQENFIYNCL